MNTSKKPIVIWLFTGVFMIAAMVVIGGITRLTESGLSMVNWRLIAGTFPPLSESEWLRVFNEYQQSPEFKELNTHFTLADFKSIFWWEYIHRLWGRLIGLVFIFPLAWFLIKGWVPKKLTGKLIAIFILGAFQAFLGWFMVKSGLVSEPRVSHYRLAAHLITAFFAFSFTLWVAFDYWRPVAEINKFVAKKSSLIQWFFVVLIVQIFFGALVAGLDAGSVHNHFPKMENDAWFSEAAFLLEPLWLNFLETKSGVQLIHRYLAYLVVALAIFLVVKLKASQLTKTQLLARNLLGAAVGLQFLLGVFTLLYSVPIVLGVLHQFGALFVLSAAIYLSQQTGIFKKRKEITAI